MVMGMVMGMGVVMGMDGQLNGSVGDKYSYICSYLVEFDVVMKCMWCVCDVGERGDELECCVDCIFVFDLFVDGGVVDEFWWIVIL